MWKMDEMASLLGYLWFVGALVLAALTLSSICRTLGGRLGLFQSGIANSATGDAATAIENAQICTGGVRWRARLLAHWVFDGLFIMGIFFIR
jgi:hypothetical protein